MLTENSLLFKKFDYVYIMSPSHREYKKFNLPAGNFLPHLDFTWINEKIKKHFNSTEYLNILFVFDDVISDLHKNRYSKEITDLIFNRRHLLNNGMVSIIITSQKYKFVPSQIRANLTVLITFKLNNNEFKQISDEIIFSDCDFKDIVNFVFDDDKDSFLMYRLDSSIFFKKFDKINI